MRPDEIIPVYIVSGFLDSGKTTLIHSMFDDDSFSRGQKTLLVVCEEGEVEYDEKALAGKNVQVHMVDSVEEMEPRMFVELSRRYPDTERVIIEYNSMFTFAKLNTMVLPKRWELVQVIALVESATFENYIANMRQQMADPLQNADLILFNRCEEGMPISSWRRQMRAMNSNATILFEFTDGHSDDGVSDEDLPYDMKADIISISEDQFGTFYLDALDHPQRYDGKTLKFKGQVFGDNTLPKDFYLFGRLAMTCCANDITCCAFMCRGGLRPSQTKWYTLTCKVECAYSRQQDREMIVLTQIDATVTDKAKDKYVTFN